MKAGSFCGRGTEVGEQLRKKKVDTSFGGLQITME